MNGGTSLRPDAVKQASGAVSQGRFKHRYLLFGPVPQTSRIPRFVRAYPVSGPPPIIKDRHVAPSADPPTSLEADRARDRGCARACAGVIDAGAAGEGPAGDPRHRGRATVARLHPADPAGGGAGKAEHPGRDHQRQRLQRLRRRWPPHFRELRRDPAIGDPEPADRGAGARNRAPRGRPSRQDARAAGAGADADDHRHAARRRRDGGGHEKRQRQQRPRQCRRRDDRRSAGNDPTHA